jgi:hypothetical protein
VNNDSQKKTTGEAILAEPAEGKEGTRRRVSISSGLGLYMGGAGRYLYEKLE